MELQQWLLSFSFESNTKPWHVLDTFLSVALRPGVEIRSGPLARPGSHCLAALAGSCSVVTVLKTPNASQLLFAKGHCGPWAVTWAQESIASRHIITSHRIASHCITSSHHIASHHIALHRILSITHTPNKEENPWSFWLTPFSSPMQRDLR